MAPGSQRATVLGTAAAAVLLLLAAPSPAECLQTLAGTTRAADATAPLIALLALLAWALAAWLTCTVLLTAGGQLPGQAGRALRAAARRTAPAAVRRSVEVALGLTVVVGGLASPAAAAPGTEVGAASAPVVSLDRASSARAPEAAPDLDWSAAAPAAPTAPAGPSTAPVVVQPGDTLWDLAEQELRERRSAQTAGGTEPTDAEVAAAWPAWWSANREAVGDDPHLLRPGTPLAPPGAGDAPAAG